MRFRDITAGRVVNQTNHEKIIRLSICCMTDSSLIWNQISFNTQAEKNYLDQLID